MDSLNISIDRYAEGYRVTTSSDGGNDWGVGITFLTVDGAKHVASAIAEAAEADVINIRVNI